MSTTYYQTTAKPRGRRETGASETPTRSRAPSESANLTKRISRTSDESSTARNTNSRPNSPATFTQKHRILDRSSLLETIIPKSSSSTSLKSNKANAVSESDASSIIPSFNPPGSTPTSPVLTAYKQDTRDRRRSLHSKTSSKSMTDTSRIEIGKSTIVPRRVTAPMSDASERKTLMTCDTPEESYEPRSKASLQPSVAGASEDNTPTPTPSHEPSQAPFESNRSNRPASQSSHKQSPSSQQSEVLPQPVQPPPQAWYSDPPSQQWHTTASPPQSPIIHQYGGFQVPGQIQYPYDFSYGYGPHMPTPGYQAYANPYYPPPFSPPVEAGQPPPIEHHVSRSGSGDENNDLMVRIQSVLPDLSRLLEQYREGQAQPTAAENPVSRALSDQNEKVIILQQELDATRKEYERVIRNLVDENCTLKNEAKDRQRRSRSLEGDSRGSRKLKSEYEALQAQHQNLASSVDSIRLSKEELIAEKLGVEKHIEVLKKDKHIIKDSHHRVLADLRSQHNEAMAAKDNEHQRAIAEHKSLISKVQLDLAILISKHTTTKRELENAHHSHTQYCDKLKGDHQRALESLKHEHKSQRLRHEDETKKYLRELEAFRTKEIGWESKSQALHAEVEEHNLALATERNAHANLKAIHEERNQRTADLAEAMTSWRKKHAELQKENENLDGVLHGLGFGSDAAEGVPDPQAPDLTTNYNKTTSSVEQLSSPTENSEEAMQPTLVDIAKPAITPVVEVKQELSKMAETVQPKHAERSTESLRATEDPSIAEEEAMIPKPIAKPFLVEPEKSHDEVKAPSGTEKAAIDDAKSADAPSQPAEERPVFRPIHYYQIPGQY